MITEQQAKQLTPNQTLYWYDDSDCSVTTCRFMKYNGFENHIWCHYGNWHAGENADHLFLTQEEAIFHAIRTETIRHHRRIKSIINSRSRNDP